jgi:hypothetical protein
MATDGPGARCVAAFDRRAGVGFRNGIPVPRALATMGDSIPPILDWFRSEFETPAARKLWGLSRGSWIATEPTRPARTGLAGWAWESIAPTTTGGDRPDAHAQESVGTASGFSRASRPLGSLRLVAARASGIHYRKIGQSPDP